MPKTRMVLFCGPPGIVTVRVCYCST